MLPMKVRAVESEVSRLRGFAAPRVALEQYCTPAELAARAAGLAGGAGALRDALVLDACAGPGALAAAAALLGARVVVCAEVDAAALDALADNKRALAERHPRAAAALQPLQIDLLSQQCRWDGVFDTVLMNPPFGTKHNAGVDMALLEVALRAARTHVFSFHKTTTRKHVGRTVGGRAGIVGEVVAEMRFPLPRSMRFHTRASGDVAVDLWHFTKH